MSPVLGDLVSLRDVRTVAEVADTPFVLAVAADGTLVRLPMQSLTDAVEAMIEAASDEGG